MKCQMTFGLTYKHHCVVHSHRFQDSSKSLIADNIHQSQIKFFLNDDTEMSVNNSKLWNDHYNVFNYYKYYRYCRIYDEKEEQSKEYMECCENLRVRVNYKTSLNFMTTHVNNMIFNSTIDLGYIKIGNIYNILSRSIRII